MPNRQARAGSGRGLGLVFEGPVPEEAIDLIFERAHARDYAAVIAMIKLGSNHVGLHRSVHRSP